MFNRSFQNGEFLQKRFVWADAPGAPATGSTGSIPENEEELSHIGKLPGLDKPDKLVDVEDRKQSATEIIQNLGKIQTMDADQLVNQYRNRYAAILDGVPITVDIRTDIQREEYERFIRLASENAKAEIERLRSENTPTYNEAVDRIVSGANFATIDDKKTRDLLDGLDLKNTKTIALREKVKELADLKAIKADTEKRLDPLNDELKKHEESKIKIDRINEWWKESNKWSYKSPILKTIGYTAMAGILGGVGLGIGAGLLGMPGLAVASFVPKLIASTVAAIPGLVGLSPVGSLGIVGMGYGLLEWGDRLVTSPMRFMHNIGTWSRKRAITKERRRLEIDTKLSDDIKEAEATIKKYKESNEGHAKTVTEHLNHYKTKQTETTKRLGETRSDDPEIANLQQELTKISEAVVALDTILLLLNSTNNPGSLGTTVPANDDTIVANIRKMGTDKKMQEKLLAVANTIDTENKKQQKTIADAEYKAGVRKEIGKLDNQTTIDSITAFLNDPIATNIPGDLESLKTNSVKLYNTLKAMAALPSDNLFRRRTTELLLFAIADAALVPKRSDVTNAFKALKPELQRVLQSKPQRIATFDPATILPTAGPGVSFDRWVKTLNSVELTNLVPVLEMISTHGTIERGGLIDRVTQERVRIIALYDDIDDDALKTYFDLEAKEALESAARILKRPRDFLSLPRPTDSLMDNVGEITDLKLLNDIKDLLPSIKGKLYVERNELKAVADAEKEITDAIKAIPEEVLEAIKNNTLLVIEFANRPARTLSDPRGAPEENSLEVYGKSLVGSILHEEFLRVLQRIKNGRCAVVERNGTPRLRTGLDNQRLDLFEQTERIKRMFASAYGNPPGYVLDTPKLMVVLTRNAGRTTIPALPARASLELQIMALTDTTSIKTYADLCQKVINTYTPPVTEISEKIVEREEITTTLAPLIALRDAAAAIDPTLRGFDPATTTAITAAEAEITRLNTEIAEIIRDNNIPA